jgi:uncharacterized protein (DUF488 family)
VIYTIGHSTHPIESFINLLRLHHLRTLADARSFPSSRRWPQFNRVALESALTDAGIQYLWIPALGGRRPTTASSRNVGWKHPAFRSYADYAGTREFQAGLHELAQAAATGSPLAIMCSEGLWWRCHRRIIADYLVVAGVRVIHVMPDGKTSEHSLCEFARIEAGQIIYDAGTAGRLFK